MIKYCLPIIKNNKKEVLQMINENLSNYSYFEIWLDYTQDLDTEFIDFLISSFEEKIIFLFRRRKLEETQMILDKKEKILWQLINSKTLLDLDINDQKIELDYIKQKNLKLNLILSFHDYEKTPDLEELKNIIKRMDGFSPNIYKVAGFCNDEADAVKLLNVLVELKQSDKKFIILGMGKEGVVTRIFGSLWGNEMVFAPNKLEEKSAEGQFSREEFERILKELKV